MNYLDRNPKFIGERLVAYLAVLPLTLKSYERISGISQSTLSRIVNGALNFEYHHIITFATSFGVTTIQFQNEHYPIPEKENLIKNLKKYIRENNRDIDLSRLIRDRPTAHLLDTYIENGGLDTPKPIDVIKKEMAVYFEMDLDSKQIFNLLASRHQKNIVSKGKTDSGRVVYQRI